MSTTGALWGSGTPATSGTPWSNVTNAAGTNNATFATWTSTVSTTSASITVEGFGVQTTIGSTPTAVGNVSVTVYAFVDNTTRVNAINVQLTDAGTLIGSAQTMTRSTTSTTSQTFTFTGVTWAQLANLGVNVKFNRGGTALTSTASVDAVSVDVTYTPGVPSGSGVGAFQWAGSGVGSAARRGVGSGAFQWAGVASGSAVKRGVGSGAYQFVGAGSGVAPSLGLASGSGVGSFGWVGSASGAMPVRGSGSGAFGWVGVGVGAAVKRGVGVGSYGWVGSAAGSAAASGSGSGSFEWAGVAVGSVPLSGGVGSGVGSFGWSSLGFGDNGQAPVVTSLTHTPVGILSVIPLLPATELDRAVPVTRTSILAPVLSAEYPAHPAQGEDGAPEVVEGTVGFLHLWIDGQDVTYFRGGMTTIRRWESEAPFGDTVAAFEFPQLNPWDKPGEGDLSFLKRDARVAVGMVETTVGEGFTRTSVRRLWSGFLDARGNGLGAGEDYSWEAKGTFWQAQSQIREPHAITEPVDIGVWIARVMNAVEGRRWATMPLTPIGITTMTRGSRDEFVMEYVQALLSEAITDDLRQWTLVEVAPGVPRLVLKPAPTTVHATVAYGTPGVDIDLRVDESTRVDRIFMRGIGPKMGGWANVYYPRLNTFLDAPPYPMASLTDYMVLGTRDSDTVSGSGVTDLQRRIDELDGFANPPVSGVMSAAWVAVIDDLQRRLHIDPDGVVGPQTWARVFDGRPNLESLTPRRLPMASKIEAEKYLYTAEGRRIGTNPQWDGRVARDIAIDIGVGKTKAAGFKLARKLLGIYGEPAATGQIVWTTDPRETDRTRLSHLSNVKVTGFEGEDRVVQVSAKSVELEASDDGPVYVVTTRVDERARDAMVVEDMLEQRRDAAPDPSRRPGVTNRSSRQVSDQRVPWDSESECGKVRRTAVNGASGLWTGITVPFAEIGKLAGIRLHSTQPFMFGLFASLRITENKMASRGNPWTADDFWTDNKDYFDQYGVIEGWGQKDQACGYSPKVETAIPGAVGAGPFTQDFILDTPVDYWTETPPAMKIMVHMRGGSGWIWGEFIPAYEA